MLIIERGFCRCCKTQIQRYTSDNGVKYVTDDSDDGIYKCPNEECQAKLIDAWRAQDLAREGRA